MHTFAHVTSSMEVGCIHRSVMVWDIRPPVQKVYSQSSTLDMDYPYNYLDLKWKPFIKVISLHGSIAFS